MRRKLTLDEILDIMKDVKVKAEHYVNMPKGGQQVSISPVGATITHEELGITIFIGYYRTFTENRKKATDLFKFALEDLEIQD